MFRRTFLAPVRRFTLNKRRFLYHDLQWNLVRYNSFVSSNKIKNSTLNTIFNDKSWALQNHLIKAFDKKSSIIMDQAGEIIQKNVIPIFKRYPELKSRLQISLERVYNDEIISKHDTELQLKNIAWAKLKKHIFNQLTNYQLSNTSLRKYNDYLFDYNSLECIYSNIVKNLVEVDYVDILIWNKLIGKNVEIITTQDKYDYLISQCYKYIYQQQTIPFNLQLDDTDTLDTVDISNPAQWFNETRKMKRHIIMHLGPTNSGKTFRALQRLKQAKKGYYGGPLRLLAREVHDKFRNEGIRCNLLTGEEIIEDLNSMGNKAGITSGTIEMIPLNTKFDVVVIDEIQMMADPDRGWAWTNALLGVQAREVHVCGEPSTYNILKKIVKMTGDKLILNEYDRLGKLNVEKKSLAHNYKKLRKGDCLVAFSKKKILDLKLDIEKRTNFKVAVIYGSLPPETRVQQANLFNSGEYDILVASDAIGMGLNLSIDRIIFTTSKKFNGSEMIQLSDSQIKQIGGRAGRFKSNSNTQTTKKSPSDGCRNRDSDNKSVGYITAMDGKTLEVIRSGIEAPVKNLNKVVIWPIDEICSQLMIRYPPGTKVSFLLRTLAKQLEQDESSIFELSDLSNKLSAISMFEHMNDISFFDKLRLSTAPVKDTALVKKAFIGFCDTIARGETRGLLSYKIPFHYLSYKYIPDESVSLEKYESLYNIIMLFFWLSNRYPEYFVDLESARDLKLFCELIIFEKLDRLKRNPYLLKFR
ncbi:ATP-dependent RNA helicase SUV3 PWA37_000897 [Arxiozyma heterogenica]|uniref:ATP-dependent RNA helicase SUV3 n=1 Tax=Arxiozyma heterogenica TaxID=278026 RepID=UPI002EEC9080